MESMPLTHRISESLSPQRLALRAGLATTLIAALWLVLVTHTVQAEEPVTSTIERSSSADLDEAVLLLASSEFSERQRGFLTLREAGIEAVDHLTGAASSSDAEVRHRALELLCDLGLSPRDPTHLAEQALAQLAEQSMGVTSRNAASALRRLQVAREDRAIEEIRRLGGTVNAQDHGRGPYSIQIRQGWLGGDEGVDHVVQLGNIQWLSLEGSDVTDAVLPKLAKIPEIKRLFLGSTKLSGGGLATLAPLVDLEYLSLKQLPIDDRDLQELPEFPKLMSLGLDFTEVTDAGLTKLPKFAMLDTLWLDATRVTDEGMLEVAKISTLRSLFMPATQVKGPGFSHLMKLASLRYLSLKGVQLDDVALQHLVGLENIEILGLDHTNVTDKQIEQLVGMTRLKTLWLSKTAVTDGAIESLSKIRSLQTVYLHGSEVSADGAERLRRELPGCHVSR
ncbi:hypothetical protein Psta_0882 [Pirellula staleyi DSM 6068]|uniref:Leucine Rich repeats (2 copies) n=1 Tax=Pirellula staleyi (strain ATCC 27377 / DSM 6068 / ICPB 4128) TaxID=530564 RepID=D2R771_PIRSD|nr:hypothetical protein Psta_0882 [Pirellula staleyi DSM 6068]